MKNIALSLKEKRIVSQELEGPLEDFRDFLNLIEQLTKKKLKIKVDLINLNILLDFYLYNFTFLI
jgi:hypothetical protein